MNDDIIKTGPDAGKTELQLAAEVFDPKVTDEAYAQIRLASHAAQQMSDPEKFDVFLRDPHNQIGRALRMLIPEDFGNLDLSIPKIVILAYLKQLKDGEVMVETGNTALKGFTGTVYRNPTGDVCILWTTLQGKMGTSATWGARRASDVERAGDELAELLWFGQERKPPQRGHVAVWLWLWDRINEACPIENEVKINRPAHLLACLAEECSETAKDVNKILRFGTLDRVTHHPMHPPVLEGPTNTDRLVDELNDIMAVAVMLVREGIIPAEWENLDKQAAKQAKVLRYMRYAMRKGVLTRE